MKPRPPRLCRCEAGRTQRRFNRYDLDAPGLMGVPKYISDLEIPGPEIRRTWTRVGRNHYGADRGGSSRKEDSPRYIENFWADSSVAELRTHAPSKDENAGTVTQVRFLLGPLDPLSRISLRRARRFGGPTGPLPVREEQRAYALASSGEPRNGSAQWMLEARGVLRLIRKRLSTSYREVETTASIVWGPEEHSRR